MGWVSNVCHLLFNCSSSSTPPLSSLSDFVPSVLPLMDVAFIPNFGSRSTEITEVVDCYGLTQPLILGILCSGPHKVRYGIRSWRFMVGLEASEIRKRKWKRHQGGRMEAINLESRAALLAAEQGTLLADIVIQMLGTDYARILRAIYAFPQMLRNPQNIPTLQLFTCAFVKELFS
ncbi:unnamed protein product [Lactuca saligna]|uniref:Uncharacterized protein n=1 Tax=Lactuca saligna TaxID=75948 RepID=A0AA35ZJP9_LACSI|nr:unnamed protein product [Lactuca saligna]